MAESGRKDAIGIGLESSFGGGQAAEFWIPATEMSHKENIRYEDDNGAINRIEDKKGSDITAKSAEVTFGGIVRDESFGLLLLLALGTVNTTGSDPYTHAFSVKNDNSPKSAQIDPGNSGPAAGLGQELFKGQVLDTLEISVVAEEYAKFAAKFMGKFPDGALSGNYTDVTEKKFAAPHFTAKLASAIAGLDGASAVNVRSAKILIAKNTELRFLTGSTDVNSAKNKTLTVSGEMELELSSTYHTLFEAGTKQAVRFELVDSNIDLGGGVNPSLQIDLSQCSLRDLGKNGGIDDINTQTFKFNAEFKVADAAMITAELINAHASYE